MKTFCVAYTYNVTEDVEVRAKNKKEAMKKFREIHPDERVTDIWETRRDTERVGY
jgi:hypothetical protein